MNSINIISSRVSPPTSPVPSRSNSISAISLAASTQDIDEEGPGEQPSVVDCPDPELADNQTANINLDAAGLASGPQLGPHPVNSSTLIAAKPAEKMTSGHCGEETPLLAHIDEKTSDLRSSQWHTIPRRITTTFIASLRLVLSALAAPGVYLWACFCDKNGNFAPLIQLRRLFGLGDRGGIKLQVEENDTVTGNANGALGMVPKRRRTASNASTMSYESENERPSGKKQDGSSRSFTRRHSRSTSLHDGEETIPGRRSIRIKLHEGESLRQRKHRKAASTGASSSSSLKHGVEGIPSSDVAAHLKSPTSPAAALTKYPRAPAPPRPLVPRRQPSYINYEPSSREGQKTLVLDLDETLIHSMSKGGRMGTGHMVEVRLSTSYANSGGQTTIGPQHPILYFVHKRPHCDEFLRRVHKWYNLVIFTASVQEYADPVIDWLESERKFFAKRYYRQHCTFRHGAFIKDLSSVEPDLSKVMILDNSPLSYMFHQGMFSHLCCASPEEWSRADSCTTQITLFQYKAG